MSDKVQKKTRKHVSDMLGVERHILQAIERQRESEYVRDQVQANKIIIEIERTIKEHVASLEKLVSQEKSDVQAAAKKVVTGAMGIVAGLYDKTREEKLSRMLRDDYTALSLATMSYTAMHAYGLAVEDHKVAALAKNHLNNYTPLQMELSKIIPSVVVEETADELDLSVDQTVREQALNNTQEAWRPPAGAAV